MKTNIALIGMPGSYKTTVGKILAKKLGLGFFDSDEVYEKKYKEKISKTFETLGEEEFRKREGAIIKDLSEKSNCVISTGGGTVLNKNNVLALKHSATIVYLSASVKTLYNRIEFTNTRPLLANGTIEKMESLFTQRKELYENAKDYTICTEGLLPDEIAQKIIDIVSI